MPSRSKSRIRLFIAASTFILLASAAYLINVILHEDYRKIFDYWSSTPRLQRPVSVEALAEVKKNRKTILATSKYFGVSPIAVAGIIVAEVSLHTGPINYFEEYYVRAHFLSQTDEYLERLAIATENDVADRRLKGESEQEFKFRLSRGLIWSTGLCRISILKAIKLEPTLATLEGRPTRNVRQVIESLLVPAENLKYCCLELRVIQDKYKAAGFEIANRPDILATLFNTGRVDSELARHLRDKGRPPKPNDFGQYVTLHSDLLEAALASDQ
jgi:hypothetical protein